eukprot:gene147-4393_t
MFSLKTATFGKTLVEQTRSMGARHLVRKYKGKLYVDKFIKEATKRKKSNKQNKGMYEALKIKSQTFNWKPETEVETLYQNFITNFIKNPKFRFGPRFLNSVLQKSNSALDLQYCSKIFHLYATRYFEFDRNTSSLFYEKFSEFEQQQEINELIKNSVCLTLPFRKKTILEHFSLLIQNSKMDEFNELCDLFTKHKIYGFGKPTYNDYLVIISMLKTENGDHDEKIIEIYEKMKKPTFSDIDEYTEDEIKYFKSLQDIFNEIKPLAQKLEKKEIVEQVSFLLNESTTFMKSISN